MGVRTEREGSNNGSQRSEKKVDWYELAVMHTQLNEESRVELKDTSRASSTSELKPWNRQCE